MKTQIQLPKINRALARKVLQIVDAGLTRGKGRPKPGEMCVEAAVCFAIGLPHSDDPPCVSPAVRSFKIALNDSQWSSNVARARGLRRLAIAQLGSDEIDDAIFVKELTRLTIRKIIPVALRAAASIHPDRVHQHALNTNAENCEKEGSVRAARAASDAASYAARAARAASDEVLCAVADVGVEALKLAKSPGCKWLNLAT
jgi:hypothetical protein